MLQELERIVKDNIDDVVKWRRYIHENPELSFQEYETTKYIKDIIETLDNVEIIYEGETGLVASLKGDKPGKRVALRADIDALPIDEQTEIDFKSANSGVMHACAHDMHAAMLLGSAKVLNDFKAEIEGEVVFIFQPAEEMPPGGALAILASGVLDGVDYIFSSHIMTTIDTGKIAMKPGAFFAASDRFSIDVIGRGGHAAAPNLAIDPVVISAQIILGLQTIVSRLTSPLHSPIISTTVVNTEGAFNVIPNKVNVQGSIRNYDAEVRDETEKYVREISEGIAKTYHGSVDITYTRGYPALMNNEEAFEISKKAALEFLNEDDIVILKDPVQASEDFAYYLEKIPGNYCLIGSRNVKKNTDVSVHNPKFKADEDSLFYGVTQNVATINELLINKQK